MEDLLKKKWKKNEDDLKKMKKNEDDLNFFYFFLNGNNLKKMEDEPINQNQPNWL